MRTNTLPEKKAGTVRSATSSQSALVYRTMAAAFEADPVARWAFRDDRLYRTVFPHFAKAYAGRAFDHGRALIADGGRGAALWLPPGVEPDEGGIVSLFERHLDPEALGETLELLERMGELHPAEPHWYLALLGVQPEVQGNGIGSALLEAQLRELDRAGATAYLESSNPKNISLYLRHGFEITGEIQVGSSPVLWSMLRTPRMALL